MENINEMDDNDNMIIENIFDNMDEEDEIDSVVQPPAPHIAPSVAAAPVVNGGKSSRKRKYSKKRKTKRRKLSKRRKTKRRYKK